MHVKRSGLDASWSRVFQLCQGISKTGSASEGAAMERPHQRLGLPTTRGGRRTPGPRARTMEWESTSTRSPQRQSVQSASSHSGTTQLGSARAASHEDTASGTSSSPCTAGVEATQAESNTPRSMNPKRERSRQFMRSMLGPVPHRDSAPPRTHRAECTVVGSAEGARRSPAENRRLPTPTSGFSSR